MKDAHLLNLLIISPKSNLPEVASKSRAIHLPNSCPKNLSWIHGLIDIHAASAQSVRSNKVFNLHFQLFPEDGIDTRMHITDVHMEVSPQVLRKNFEQIVEF